ncbi:hypothetical protein ACFL47_02685 [Candidatus Latescibacterota bacterium]
MLDQFGNHIDHRVMGTKDLAKVLDEQYIKFVKGQYENCRALSLVMEEIWPMSQEPISESRRISAWATLFLYSEKPADLTSLENEKRNLLILAKASSEFSAVDGIWDGEAEVVNRAINVRLIDKKAFNTFVKSLRSSADGFAFDGGLNNRKKAIETVNLSHPYWCQTVGLDRLKEFPWRHITP